MRVDEVDHAASALIQAAKLQIAGKQWGEALDRLQQANNQFGDRLWKIDDRRFVPLRTYCQITIASLPPEGLAAYRDRVDPEAKLIKELATPNDVVAWETLVDRYFNSSFGDEALLALGDLAFERGWFDVARARWRGISRRLLADSGDQPLTPVLVYPDSDIDLAGIRARLALASIVEGDLQRATREIRWLEEQHPHAKGSLGGRDLEYAQYLQALLKQAVEWPRTEAPNDAWPTFAGAPSRQHLVRRERQLAELTAPVARFDVPPEAPVVLQSDDVEPNPFANAQINTGDPVACYFPIVARNLLLFSTENEIFAYRVKDGEPAWGGDSAASGRIHTSGDTRPPRERRRSEPLIPRGAPRFTLTVHDRWLLARMGSQVTGELRNRRGRPASGEVVCLDLQAEGRLQWKLRPDDDRWALEGTPICDADQVYIAMRYNDEAGQTEQHVACFDIKTGKLKWRRFVCSADSLSRYVDEVTHNLLALSHGCLYFNTNSGAVASISCVDGRIGWLTTYPRQISVQSPHAMQSRSPAVCASGAVYVAPDDFDGVMAFEAHTGRVLWEGGPPGESVQLLGVAGGKVWLAGQRLFGLDARSGQLTFEFPGATGLFDNTQLVGCGRGVLTESRVYWPASVRLSGKENTEYIDICVVDAGPVSKLETRIRLNDVGKGEWSPSHDGGNLIMTGRSLVIAGPQRISLFNLPTERVRDRDP